MSRVIALAGWALAALGWVLLLVNVWGPGFVRPFVVSALYGLGVVLGSAGALSLILALVQTFFLERIKQWVEKRRLEMAHAQRIIETMVTMLHNYSEKYYMQLGRTAQQFLNACRRSDWQDAFYFFVLHYYHRNKFADEVGRYFLRDATAEVVVPRLARRATDPLIVPEGFLKWGEIDRMVEELLPSPQKAGRRQFQERTASGWGKEKYEEFTTWLEGNSPAAQKVLRNMEAYSLLLLLEINLAYGAWYERIHADLTTVAQEEVNGTLPDLVGRQVIPADEAEAYLRRIERFLIRPRAKA